MSFVTNLNSCQGFVQTNHARVLTRVRKVEGEGGCGGVLSVKK